MKQYIFFSTIATLVFATVLYAITIPDPTTFLDKIIVERRVGEPASTQADRGRIFFDETDRKFKGDDGLLIFEFGTSLLGNHTMLSALHTDTVAGTPVQGDLMLANATPKFAKFGVGAANQLLAANTAGTTLEYKTLTATANETTVSFAAGIATIGIVDPLIVGKGGTGADLSATGGVNQFVKQSGVGAVLTIGTIADADVPNTITLDNITQITARAITDLTGTLTVGNGGTGLTTITDGGVMLGSGAGAVTAMAVLADSEFIVGNGATDPVAESGSTARTSMGAAVNTATYLTTVAEAELSGEIVVGATPGGELGGTHAVPTVDATHSGSTHPVLIDRQNFDASGTWTKPSGFTTDAIVIVEMWAGGGGGGRSDGTNSAGGGGGGGAYHKGIWAISDLGGTETTTVGAAGSSATVDGDGGVGGNTSFNGVTVFGGGGGHGQAGETTIGGGGGGGGLNSVGLTTTTEDGGNGGDPKAGGGSSTTAPGGDAEFGGAGGGHADGVNASAGGVGVLGGGGGGGGANVGDPPNNGGNAIYGGAGGGGGGDASTHAGPGGTSNYGGNGGAGAVLASNGTAGTQPAGGGGGSNSGNSGAGGAGRIIAWTVE